MLSSHINHHQLQSEHVSHSFFVFYQMLNVKIAMLIFIKWNEVNRRNKFSLSKSLFSVMEILYKKECQRIYCCCNYAQSCKNISCKHFNRKTLHDNFSVKKIVFDCNSFKYKQNRLSDARLMKNIVKKITCKWACITIFKQLQHSQTLSPSFKYTYTSLKQSQKTHFKKDLTRIILFRTYEHSKLYIILCIDFMF